MSFDYAVRVTEVQDGWTFDWGDYPPILGNGDSVQISYTEEEGWHVQIVRADHSIIRVHVVESRP